MAQAPADSTTTGTRLTLSESPDGTGRVPVEWANRMFVLGTKIARFAQASLPEDRQLVVALSVPARDFTSVLLGSGWTTVTAPKPLSSLEAIPAGGPVRLVTCGKIATGTFREVKTVRGQERVVTTAGIYQRETVRAIAHLDQSEDEVAGPRPEPGFFASYVGLAQAWDQRLANPAADLAIVGTRTWLDEDLDTFIGVSGRPGNPTRIRDVLLPSGKDTPTVGTYVYSAGNFADVDVPEQVQAVILDGTTAIRYLNQIEARVVICVLDRSVVDETAADLVLARRNPRGRPLEDNELNWLPPVGVELMAFTVKRKKATW